MPTYSVVPPSSWRLASCPLRCTLAHPHSPHQHRAAHACRPQPCVCRNAGRGHRGLLAPSSASPSWPAASPASSSKKRKRNSSTHSVLLPHYLAAHCRGDYFWPAAQRGSGWPRGLKYQASSPARRCHRRGEARRGSMRRRGGGPPRHMFPPAASDRSRGCPRTSLRAHPWRATAPRSNRRKSRAGGRRSRGQRGQAAQTPGR